MNNSERLLEWKLRKNRLNTISEKCEKITINIDEWKLYQKRIECFWNGLKQQRSANRKRSKNYQIYQFQCVI